MIRDSLFAILVSLTLGTQTSAQELQARYWTSNGFVGLSLDISQDGRFRLVRQDDVEFSFDPPSAETYVLAERGVYSIQGDTLSLRFTEIEFDSVRIAQELGTDPNWGTSPEAWSRSRLVSLNGQHQHLIFESIQSRALLVWSGDEHRVEACEAELSHLASAENRPIPVGYARWSPTCSGLLFREASGEFLVFPVPGAPEAPHLPETDD